MFEFGVGPVPRFHRAIAKTGVGFRVRPGALDR